MKIKELIEEATKALRAAIRGERRPRPIIFDSIKDLSNALIRAKKAHSEFERGSGAKDYNWPLWYAAYIAMEQGSEKKSASKLASSAIEVSAGSENAPPIRVVSFFHLRPVAISVSYLEGNLLGHGRDGSEANSAWHELAVTFGGPRRRTMICRTLRYRVVTATLFYYSRNIASTSIRTLLGGPF